MTDLGRADLRQGFKRFLHCRLTVAAHHTFDMNRACDVLRLYSCPAAMVMPRIAQLAEIQTQCVGYHAEARQAHGSRAEHGIERQTKRHKAPRRQRNADHVVEKRPKKIFMNIAQCCTTQPNRSRNIHEAVFHQHDVRRVNCNIRTRADGNADVRACQRRGVVDAVAHHGNTALLLQSANNRLLAIRQNARDYLIHTRQCADGLGRALVITRQHHNADAHVL